MFSNNSNNNPGSKLHPVYVALDGHQYQRAIKLCLALPNLSENLLGQALLAHAYAKTNQRLVSLQILQRILTSSGFIELQLELQACTNLSMLLQKQHPTNNTSINNINATNQTIISAVTSTKKTGKKGKKKPIASNTSISNNNNATSLSSTENAIQPTPGYDWIDVLDNPQSVVTSLIPSQNSNSNSNSSLTWQDLLPPSNPSLTSDSTLLATMTLTLQHVLKLPLTAFQLYAWAIKSQTEKDLVQEYLEQALIHGLAVLVAPQCQHLAVDFLRLYLQPLALQLSRYDLQNTTNNNNYTGTAWAAQYTLWLYKEVDSVSLKSTSTLTVNSRSNNSSNDSDDNILIQKQKAIWPRLASSFAQKVVQADVASINSRKNYENNNNNNTHTDDNVDDDINNSALVHAYKEHFLLYIQALEIQKDYAATLQAVDSRLQLDNDGTKNNNKNITSNTIKLSPPRQTLLEIKVKALQHLQRYEEVVTLLEDELLPNHPDQWTYWLKHVESVSALSTKANGESSSNVDDGLIRTEKFADDLLEKFSSSSGYIIRGPYLIKLEVAAARLRADSCNSQRLVELVQCVIEYSTLTASKVLCTFNDVRPYIEFIVECSSQQLSTSTTTTTTTIAEECNEHLLKLLQWLKSFRVVPSDADERERKKQLMKYIFCTQALYLIMTKKPELKADFMPCWKEMIEVWQNIKSQDQVDQAQKESRPVDELVLLATQQLLLAKNITENELYLVAVLLEAAIQYSPYNAYLKIFAMFVYSQLDAVGRSWELYQDLYIKHIQNESCTYLILPLLLKGGYYGELIAVCQEILRLQTTAAREVVEYSGRAMRNGTLSKAEEFITFHREHMNKSLTTLEAKGLILHCAALYQYDDKHKALGSVHGIVGSDNDMERASKIICEAHNPFAAFSMLRLKGETTNWIDSFTDNRDMTILYNDLLLDRQFDSKEKIVKDSIRRGLQHNLLIRAVLCVDATKGVKNGKAVKSSDELKKRCQSLYETAQDALNINADNEQYNGAIDLVLKIMSKFCCILVVVCSGHDSKTSTFDSDLKSRESFAVDTLQQIKSLFQRLDENHSMTSLAEASTSISEWLVPIIALVRMCGKTFELFGWGKKKRSVKKCAEYMADATLELLQIVLRMLDVVERRKNIGSLELPKEYLQNSVIANIASAGVGDETLSIIKDARSVSAQRLLVVLDEIRTILEEYDT